MARHNVFSQFPTITCDYCGKLFEIDDDIRKDEEDNDICEECWHEENNHAQCDECGEWIEENEYYDENNDKTFCNVECQVSYVSSEEQHRIDQLNQLRNDIIKSNNNWE